MTILLRSYVDGHCAQRDRVAEFALKMFYDRLYLD